MDKETHVVIVGGGAGGLSAASNLNDNSIRVTLVDRRNYHLFQPLLYQVATGGLSPGDIASPLRSILKRRKNVTVIMDEAADIDPNGKRLILKEGELSYDILILSTGVRHCYFGADLWTLNAPGLKSIEDATQIRSRILSSFEKAERVDSPEMQRELLTFVVVGGGPTGVELAGALAELANHTLRHDFRNIDPSNARIILLERNKKILNAFPPLLSRKAERSLKRLGISVRRNTSVTDIEPRLVRIQSDDKPEIIKTQTVLWAAGVQTTGFGRLAGNRTGADLDKMGKIIVNPDLSVTKYPDIYAIGDLAHFNHPGEKPLPGVAPVAMQQGRYLAKCIKKRLRGQKIEPFKYFNRGSLAVIGRSAAVANLGERLRFSGFFAWILWLFVHLMYIVEFENRVLVFIQWAWHYFTRNCGARLITGQNFFNRPFNRNNEEK